MRLIGLAEGDVSAAQSKIVSTKNDLAIALAGEVRTLGFGNPRVEESYNVSDDSILYFDVRPGTTIMVRVVSDDDLQIQLSTGLADSLGVNDYHKVGSAAEVIAKLQKIFK